MADSKKDKAYKVTVVGQSGSGKSCLVQRIVKDTYKTYSESTIGAAYSVIKKVKNGQTNTYQIWDTAGQERYKALVPMYLKDAHIVLLIYDITNVSSFEDIKKSWLSYANDRASNALKILIGTKCDWNDIRMVNKKDASEWALSKDLKFIECSAKEGINISELVDMFFDIPDDPYEPKINETVTLTSNSFLERHESCIPNNCYVH